MTKGGLPKRGQLLLEPGISRVAFRIYPDCAGGVDYANPYYRKIDMQLRHGHQIIFGLLSRIFVRKGDQTREEKELRFLIVALSLALVLCVGFGLALYTLNKQGRF